MQRRRTKSKEDVLQVLKKKNLAMSHDMLEAEINQYDRATIYRILNRFKEDGVVHRIMGANGKQYFAVCTNCEGENHNHNHMHFQCKKCEKMECLDDEPKVDLPEGYILHDFNGLVSGLCDGCS